MSTDVQYGEVAVAVAPSVVATLAKAELDQSIVTAKAYPRSVEKFQRTIEKLATLNESVAEDCIYALPRRDENGVQKNIVGPSARFAEILLSSWGNCIAGATIVDDSGDYVTARGVFHDLESNTKVYREVRRRITNKFGKRFSVDMVGVTANACASIAQRNATYAGIPQALWSETFEKALALVKGRAETFADRRDKALSTLATMGVTPERILARLGITGIADITINNLVLLRGTARSIARDELDVDEAFPPVKPKDAATPEPEKKGTAGLKEKSKAAAPAEKPEAEAIRCSEPGCDATASKRAAGKWWCLPHSPQEA